MSLHVEVERVGDKWIGLAPWTSAPVEADTFEDLMDRIARARWTR